jgi:small subunit ribosomal protein S21
MKMQREGIFQSMRAKESYEKPREKRQRKRTEAIRHARKVARKIAAKDGIVKVKGRRRD